MAVDPRLERAYRNRMSLPPDQRAAVEQAYEAALAQSEAAWYGQEPAVEADPTPEIDSVVAADMPIAPDPAVTPKRSQPRSAMPDADPRTTRAQRLAQFEEWSDKVDRQAATYNRDTGLSSLNEGYVEEDGPYPGAGRPGYDRTFTPDELADQRAALEAERDARLKPMMEANRRDMRERQAWRENTPEQAESLAVGQRERSEDYRKERLLYRMAEQTGMSIEELRANNPQFASVGQIPSRNGAGIPTLTRTKDGMQLRNMPTSTSSMRDAAAARRIADKQARADAWKAQAMLAGGQPTGGPRGTKAATNALMMLPQEWQNLVLAKGLRPDIDGTTPLTVDANSAKNALRLMNAEVLAQGGLGDARVQMMQQQARVAADDMAQKEAAKLLGWGKTTLTRQEAERIRRRVEAVHPGMGGVVEGLPIEDAAPAAPRAGIAPGSVPPV